MEIKNQVTSLELSKRLKELNVKQESLFNWYIAEMSIPELLFEKTGYYEGEWYSAFTVAELGEMLPSGLTKEGKNYRITIVNGNGVKFIDYGTWNNGVQTLLYGYPMIEADTEADARAKCLIYLLENSLITL